MSSELIAKILDHIGVINLEKIDPQKIDAKLLSTRGKKDIVLKDGVLIQSEKLIITDRLINTLQKGSK